MLYIYLTTFAKCHHSICIFTLTVLFSTVDVSELFHFLQKLPIALLTYFSLVSFSPQHYYDQQQTPASAFFSIFAPLCSVGSVVFRNIAPALFYFYFIKRYTSSKTLDNIAYSIHDKKRTHEIYTTIHNQLQTMISI